MLLILLYFRFLEHSAVIFTFVAAIVALQVTMSVCSNLYTSYNRYLLGLIMLLYAMSLTIFILFCKI